MAKYRKKPVVIEAVELKNDSASIKEAIEFLGQTVNLEHNMSQDYWETFVQKTREQKGLEIKTLEGTMLANFGDFIIKGVQGEHYPCKPDIFEATYEKVED